MAQAYWPMMGRRLRLGAFQVGGMGVVKAVDAGDGLACGLCIQPRAVPRIDERVQCIRIQRDVVKLINQLGRIKVRFLVNGHAGSNTGLPVRSDW
jgi:hypothetical protein